MWLRDHSVKNAQDAFSTEHILDTLKSSFKFPSLHVFISSPFFLSGCFFLCHFSTIPSCINVSHVFKRSSILYPLELSSLLMSEGSHPFLWIPVVLHLHNSTNLSSPSESPTSYRQSKSFVQWVNEHHTEKKYSHSRIICLLFLSSYMRYDRHETFYLIFFLQVHSKMLHGENILVSNIYLFYSLLSSLYFLMAF